jgi:hypothetical protein
MPYFGNDPQQNKPLLENRTCVWKDERGRGWRRIFFLLGGSAAEPLVFAAYCGDA